MFKQGSLILFLLTMLFIPSAFGQTAQDIGSSLFYEPISAMKVSPFVYCCLPKKGPIKDMPTVIERFIQTTKTQDIIPESLLFGILYDVPDQRGDEQLEWEVGFLLGKQYHPKAPLMKKQWGYKLVISALHIGPYAETGKTIAKMLEWMDTRGYIPVGPVLERYLELNPLSEMKIDELKMKIEIWIPYKKREEIDLKHRDWSSPPTLGMADAG